MPKNEFAHWRTQLNSDANKLEVLLDKLRVHGLTKNESEELEDALDNTIDDIRHMTSAFDAAEGNS